MSEALRLAEYWETRAKGLQTWVDENDYVEFGYRPEGLKREQADQQRTAAELRRLHAENEALLSETRTLVRQNGEWQALNAELVEALKWIGDHDLRGCDLVVAGHMAHGFIGRARAALAKVGESNGS